MPFPTPGDFPDRGIELASLASPALAGRFFTWEALLVGLGLFKLHYLSLSLFFFLSVFFMGNYLETKCSASGYVSDSFVFPLNTALIPNLFIML